MYLGVGEVVVGCGEGHRLLTNNFFNLQMKRLSEVISSREMHGGQEKRGSSG